MTDKSALSMSTLDCNGRILNLSIPQIMGVLNVTPDSFSDGGIFFRGNRLDINLAFERAEQMVAEGASIIDVGGESTRPGADSVGVQEEMDRVLPVVEKIAAELDVIISIDTSKPELMSGGAAAGAGMINDVRALTQKGAVEAAAMSGSAVCLMHMQGQPKTMQQAPSYASVINEVIEFLSSRIEICSSAGIDKTQILIDPGFGFGKTPEHNLVLLNELSKFLALGCGLVVGLSRKSIIAAVLNRPVEDRLPASLALAVMAVERGANIVRAHDIKATSDAIHMAIAVKEAVMTGSNHD